MDFRVKQSSTFRALTNPEESLRTLVERAPEAEAWADRAKEKLQPTLTLLYAIRRRLATGAVAALAVWLFVHVMFGANGMVVYRKKKAEYEVLQQQIDKLKTETTAIPNRSIPCKTIPRPWKRKPASNCTTRVLAKLSTYPHRLRSHPSLTIGPRANSHPFCVHLRIVSVV